MSTKQEETKATINLGNTNYEEALADYTKTVCTMIKNERSKVPAESRMKVPCAVMFVIHNRDIIGYTTIKEFTSVVAEVAGVNASSIHDRVLGAYIGGTYSGLKYLITRNMAYGQTKIAHTQWNYNSKEWRYNYLVQVEERLYASMQREAERTCKDESIWRIKNI